MTLNKNTQYTKKQYFIANISIKINKFNLKFINQFK